MHANNFTFAQLFASKLHYRWHYFPCQPNICLYCYIIVHKFSNIVSFAQLTTLHLVVRLFMLHLYTRLFDELFLLLYNEFTVIFCNFLN